MKSRKGLTLPFGISLSEVLYLLLALGLVGIVVAVIMNLKGILG